MNTFRYFPTFPDGAQLAAEPCRFCGRTPAIPGIRLQTSPPTKQSVCAECLAADKARVSIPPWIEQELARGIATTYPDWNEATRTAYLAERIDELAHTPPVPWLQNNAWPICGDDFASYEGEVSQESLTLQYGEEGRAKAALRAILQQVVPEWEQDDEAVQAEWRDLGNYLAIFVFRCADSGEHRYVLQTA